MPSPAQHQKSARSKVSTQHSEPERFWEKVDVKGPNECWPWRAATRKDGTGAFKCGGKTLVAARYAAQWCADHRDGVAPARVEHICKNKSCVNPAHLRTLGER